MTGASQSDPKNSETKRSAVRRCRYCGCSIEHKAKTAKYCGPVHRTSDTRLREKAKEEIANANRDGGMVPIAMSHLGAIAEDLGMSAWDEGDRAVLGVLLVNDWQAGKLKIRALEEQLRKLKSQA